MAIAAYRTSDVLHWWNELESRGCHRELASEHYWLHRRRWDGEGMAVDVAALERWMESYLQRRLAAKMEERGIVIRGAR